jgi:predicted small secreted protein
MRRLTTLLAICALLSLTACASLYGKGSDPSKNHVAQADATR